MSDNHYSSNALYSWLVIIPGALFLFYVYILQVSPSVMTQELMREFQVDGAGLGNLAATYFYSYLIVQLFAGILLDKYGSRIFTTSAILICAIGAYGFAKAQTLWAAELFRAVMGIGAAFSTVSYMKVAANWFRANQFAFIGGLLATATMLGAVFGEAPLAALTQQIGWRQSITICAVIGVAIAVLYFLIVRDKKPASVPSDAIATPMPAITGRDLLGLVANPQNWLLTFYSGLAFAPTVVFGGLWGNPFLQAVHQLSKTHAAAMVSFVFIGLAVGGPTLGLVSDFIGKRKLVMFWGTLLALIAATMVIYITILPLWAIAVGLFFFGFGTGAFMLAFVLGKEVNPLILAGTIIALINTGDAIFGSVTEPFIGALLDWGWHGTIVQNTHYFTVKDYHTAFLVLPLYLLLALILILFIRE